MVKHSVAAISLVWEDLKKWTRAFKIAFSLFTLAYLAYALAVGRGNVYVNVVLAALYVIYTVFSLVAYKKAVAKTKKIVKRGYRWLRLLTKAFTLGSALYGLYVAAAEIDGISIVLATLTVILWVLQVLLEVLILVVEPRAKLIVAGVLMDAKPIIQMHNLFTKKENNWDVDYTVYEKEIALLTEEKDTERDSQGEQAPPEDEEKGNSLPSRLKKWVSRIHLHK